MTDTLNTITLVEVDSTDLERAASRATVVMVVSALGVPPHTILSTSADGIASGDDSVSLRRVAWAAAQGAVYLMISGNREDMHDLAVAKAESLEKVVMTAETQNGVDGWATEMIFSSGEGEAELAVADNGTVTKATYDDGTVVTLDDGDQWAF